MNRHGYQIMMLLLLGSLLVSCKVPTRSHTDFSQYDFKALCHFTHHQEAPHFLDRFDPKDACLEEKVFQPNTTEVMVRIPIEHDKPIGGLTFANYEFEEDLERIDFSLEFQQFDTTQNVYIQFYQSRIGKDGFYFGIQNRVREKDFFLLFTRWFDDSDIAQKVGLLDYPECAHFNQVRYDQKVRIYKNYFSTYPLRFKRYKDYTLQHVQANIEENGFIQSSTNELSFVGIRIPQFEFDKNHAYRFSIVKGTTDKAGTWYNYLVKNRTTGEETRVGAIRFDKGAKIHRRGGSWVELFSVLTPQKTRPDHCQYVQDLPKLQFTLQALGDGKQPSKRFLNYGPNNDKVQMQKLTFDSSEQMFQFAIGPNVLRENAPANP